MAKIDWNRTKYAGKVMEDGWENSQNNLVVVRCRGCGHLGKISRWMAENKRMKCSKCGWHGQKPKGK